MLVYVNEVPVIVEEPKNLIDMFSLDALDANDFEQLQGKHICVDPYAEDIHNMRVLMWNDTASGLGIDYVEACADI